MSKRYDFSLWQTHRWQTDSRYYTAEIVQDLFGTWNVHLGWGGLYNRKGKTRTQAVATYQDARALVQRTAQRRERRGYRQVKREGI